MAAVGPRRRARQSGTIAGLLILATTCSGALAAGPADPGNVPDQAVIAAHTSTAGGNPEGEVVPFLTPDEAKGIIQRTFSEADLQSLVGDAARGAAVASDARVRDLGAGLGLRAEALARMLAILGRENVPPERLADALAEIVARHQSLLQRVRLLETPDPRAAELRTSLAAALETADYARVDRLLAEAEAMGFEAMRGLLEALDQPTQQIAAIYPEAGVGTWSPFRAAEQGALLHGTRRAVLSRLVDFLSSNRFCQWHPQNRFCQGWAASSSLCDRTPTHALCGERFCKKNRSHPLCPDDPPPSKS